VFNIDFNANKDIKFLSIPNVKIYDFSIIFHYKEQYPNDSASATYHTVSMDYPQVILEDLTGGTELIFSYHKDEFFNLLLKKISPSSELERYWGQIELKLNVADENYYLYRSSHDLNIPAYSEEIGYSNISNGLGIFGARSSVSHIFNMSIYSKSRLLRIESLNFVTGY